jgi:nickel-dependent lactate racemase
MVPPLLDDLAEAGVREEDITVIFACASHRAVEQGEMEELLGKEILQRVRAVSHDCKSEDNAYLGQTSFGTKVYVNKTFAEADMKILTGDVGMHFFAGYGGGRKSVLPGISGQETIQKNHAMLLDSKARTGTLDGNPVSEDMTEGARLAKVDFVLNIVQNSKRKLVRAFAGDMEQVLSEGVKLIDEMYKVPIERKGDIVVASPGGHPLDINLYQAYKAIDSALKAVKRGGVIVLVAECPEGHGNEVFYEWMTEFKSQREMEREIKRRFRLGGQKAYYLTKALKTAKIFLISTMPDYYAVNVFGLKTAEAVNDALIGAFDIAGKNAKVWAMPYGNLTLPTMQS